MNYKQLLRQFLQFLSVSGIGFLIDFAGYYLLTAYAGVPIAYANMVSAIPAITWVFLFSTRRIFQKSTGRLPVWGKYIVYLLYQAVLLACVSYLAQFLYGLFYPWTEGLPLLRQYLQLLCKCLITPITMTCNFVVMKLLTEKL